MKVKPQLQIPTNENYSSNQDKFPCKGNTYPCVVCGKPCPNPKFMLWVHCGGDTAVTIEEGERLNAAGEEGSDLGSQPIGVDCLRKHPELKPYTWRVSK